MSKRLCVEAKFAADAFRAALNEFMNGYCMSYRDMADMAEISLSVTFAIAKGATPSIWNFVALCNAMERNPSDFVVPLE